jgi:hypothetical protein
MMMVVMMMDINSESSGKSKVTYSSKINQIKSQMYFNEKIFAKHRPIKNAETTEKWIFS